ncbi:hypothetical protein BS78_10G212100 [Paspalum vaginatum]|nr:hypothetical protein BS78_10G212100 [Paspalum vaginatum]
MGDETKRSTVTIALLVLACCHTALALSKLSAPHDGDPAARGVEPVGYLASVASTVVAAYVASAACGAHGRGRLRLSSLEDLLAEARRTWARPAATALYIELLTTAMASLLLTLRAFLGAADGAAAGLLTASGSVALVGWLGPVLFAHSDIACRMSLVVAAVEERRAGRAAVGRAEALVAGRRARGVAIGLVAAAVEQVPAWLCGAGAPELVLGQAVLAAKIAASCACAAFYFDCRRRHDRVGGGIGSGGCRLELDGRSLEWCQMDVADECEAEELMGSAFECFRLT